MLELRVAVAARAATAHQHSEGRGAVVTGPLDGVRVVELASIGPIPFCGLVLSDMGADVVRVDKPVDVATADPSRAPGHRSRSGAALDRGRPQVATWRGGRAATRRVRRRPDRGIPARRRRAARHRSGRLPRAQSSPRVRASHRLGTARSARRSRRARHRLHRARRARSSAFGRAGGPPTPPLNIVGDFGGGGLLLAYGIACALVSTARTGNGSGRRHRDGGRNGPADGAVLCRPPDRVLERRTRHQHARHRIAVLRHVRVRGRQVRGRGRDRAAVLRRAARRARAVGVGPARSGRPDEVERVARPCSRRASSHVPATSGPTTSVDGTRASRPCSAWPRRRSIRTTPPTTRSSRSTASSIPRRPRGSARHPRPSTASRATPASTPIEVLRELGCDGDEIEQLRADGAVA